MWKRCVLLLCLLGIGSATDSIAQGVADSGSEGPIVFPHSEVHHVTSAGGRTYTLYVQLPESYATAASVVYPVL